ncbi:MAG: FtsX-like permease family protein [Verrucomicrobiales bacterium]|nr:FtsX-like permease family protein [Verrucomicrobiales bacterium]
MINWFSQVAAVTWFGLCTIPRRKGSAIAAAVGIAGVVTVFVGVLSIAQGFRHAVTATGRDDIAVVLRDGANNEMSSGLGREDVRVIKDAPGLARENETAAASAELFVIINIPKRSTGTDANVPFRGVETAGPEIRGNLKLLQGRMFERGRNEVIAGVNAAREFAGLDVGQTLKLGRTEWNVVGIFSAGGGVGESEMWTDATVLQAAYQRGDSYQSVYAKLMSPGKFQEFKDALTSNPQIKVKVARQNEFYADQSTATTAFISIPGTIIALMMALGALLGALNTMYNAVASRGREIATLRALGFGATPVVCSVLIESLVLALAGGSIGGLGAYLAFDGYGAATMNFQTWSQIAFAFAVTPQLLARAIALAAIIGLIGGLFPAIRAARLPIASALREV